MAAGATAPDGRAARLMEKAALLFPILLLPLMLARSRVLRARRASVLRRWHGPALMVLLASIPRYFGHSMNNPKDIPFATLSAAILYAWCRLPARYPFFTWRSASALALAMGAGAQHTARRAAVLVSAAAPWLSDPGKQSAFRSRLSSTAAWLAASRW